MKHKLLYRIEDGNHQMASVIDLELHKSFGPTGVYKTVVFGVIKETPKGFWFVPSNVPIDQGLIGPLSLWHTRRWTNKHTMGRYAYPTEREALESYVHRKKKHIAIIASKLRYLNAALGKAKARLGELDDISTEGDNHGKEVH